MEVSVNEHTGNSKVDDKNTMSTSEEEEEAEQVRVSLKLSADYNGKDRSSLEVPSEAIAVPATITRKGLAAVVNHLLGRGLNDGEESDDEGSDDDDDDQLPTIAFEFILNIPGKTNNKLLRTGVEKAARRFGLSLEKAISITYFPASTAPESKGESDELPDWISGLSVTSSIPSTTNNSSDLLVTASTYDGSIHVFRAAAVASTGSSPESSMSLNKINALQVHKGSAVKCLDTVAALDDSSLWIASGSMNHSLVLQELDLGNDGASRAIHCKDGHFSALSSVDLFPSSQQSRSIFLASGDWDGGVCIWECSNSVFGEDENENSNRSAAKKKKTTVSSSESAGNGVVTITPKASIQAHTSNVSGISWGNYQKHLTGGNNEIPRQLVTSSWDHSLKSWDVERQDCLVTLAGSRVISCMDTSYHTNSIVATGHPDCQVRLWDLRTKDEASNNQQKDKDSVLAVSDNTFRPSHKAWVSSVKWSKHNPYHVTSCSHDGTAKVWDIRSSLPLHTVRAFPKNEKALSMALSTDDGWTFLGGTDCIVKQFQSTR